MIFRSNYFVCAILSFWDIIDFVFSPLLCIQDSAEIWRKKIRIKDPSLNSLASESGSQHFLGGIEDPSLNWLASELGLQNSLPEFSLVLLTTDKYKIYHNSRANNLIKKKSPIRIFCIFWDKYHFWPILDPKHLKIVNKVNNKIDYISKTKSHTKKKVVN